MSGKLENKVAVITGGSTGIGFATAKRFVTEGASVFLTGRRASELNSAAEMLGPRAVPVLADSSNLDDLDRLYEIIRREAGRIDILFANAGGGSNLPLGSITEERRRTDRQPRVRRSHLLLLLPSSIPGPPGRTGT